jgi:K+-sensing histidine kinase KdpD
MVVMKSYLANRIRPALGVALCIVAAWTATLVQWQAAKELIPIVFLVFVLALGMLFGRTVGILGSITGALIFARSLYTPLGSFRIQNQGARSSVAWMLLAGVTLSYLLLPSRRNQSPKSH